MLKLSNNDKFSLNTKVERHIVLGKIVPADEICNIVHKHRKCHKHSRFHKYRQVYIRSARKCKCSEVQ